MKRGVLLAILLFVFSFSLVSACILDVKLINQDPYPALPGDYVKITFQLTGLEDTSCGLVTFQLLQDYPFSLDPGINNEVTVRSGTYAKDYDSSLIIPYKLRVDENAVDGDNSLNVRFFTTNTNNNLYQNRNFNISVEDSRTDFEINVKDYSYTTKN